MDEIIPLHNNIFQRLTPSFRRYSVEIGLIAVALAITIFSLVQDITRPDTPSEAATQPEEILMSPTPRPKDTVIVDVSGAVYKPGVYEATAGARIGELIDMAGGISYEADRYFVARNFNLARIVGDQDKIYIPYLFDIALGTFTEQKRVLEYLQPLGKDTSGIPNTEFEVKQSTDGFTLSINTASPEELETLPGIGPVTAQKIIENRPYNSVEDLLNKKVMNQSTFEKIKANISL